MAGPSTVVVTFGIDAISVWEGQMKTQEREWLEQHLEAAISQRLEDIKNSEMAHVLGLSLVEKLPIAEAASKAADVLVAGGTRRR